MSECLDDNLALELLDGKLPSARRTTVERHIESCDACRELIVTLAKDEAEGGAGPDGPIDTQRAPATRSAISMAGPYRIEREVGSGSAGTVYRAVDERNGQVVALKYVTDPAWRTRFAREVETLARLVHPGIVRYVSHGETRQGLYLAMEWLDGEDLARCMDRGRMPWPAVRFLGLRLTAALAHAHSMGAVHRDIGPRNVFLPGGRVDQAKLLDFGLVRVHDALDRTASQAVLGTPHYMAPEQVKDPRMVDPRSDLFALGVVFFEALAGVRPFDADDLFTVWLKIVDQPAPNLRTLAPDVPETFVALIERMLAKDPAARPPTAAAVHEVLVRLDAPSASGGAVSTAVTPPLQISQRPQPMPPPPMPPAMVHLPYPVAPARTAPPPAAPQRTGLIIGIVAALAGVVVIAAIAVVLVPRMLHESQRLAGRSDKPAATGDDDDVAPQANAKTTPPAPTPAPARPAVETLFCGGEALERRRGGNYQPDPEQRELEPVIIGGDCKAVLEDCTIGGQHSVKVIGKGDLTLRRCRVNGTTQLVGDVTLTLEGTTLPSPPKIVGKGRVLRR